MINAQRQNGRRSLLIYFSQRNNDLKTNNYLKILTEKLVE